MNVFNNPISNFKQVESVEIDYKQNEIKYGDIFFTTSSETPEEVGMSSIWLENKENYYLNSFCFGFRPIINFDSYFAAYMLRTPRVRSKITLLAQGISRYNISKMQMMNIEIPFPEDDEQVKIGKIFVEIDNLITLHQRKSISKKQTWEQRKVSDIFKVTRGYVLASTMTNEKKSAGMVYPVYSSQTKDNGLMGYYKDYLYEDAITWTTDGANAGTVNYRTGKFYCTNVCGVLLSKKIKANPMIAEALNKIAKQYVSYVGNPKLMNNVMADIELQIPKQEEEREQLSQTFVSLDNLITLHQH